MNYSLRHVFCLSLLINHLIQTQSTSRAFHTRCWSSSWIDWRTRRVARPVKTWRRGGLCSWPLRITLFYWAFYCFFSWRIFSRRYLALSCFFYTMQMCKWTTQKKLLEDAHNLIIVSNIWPHYPLHNTHRCLRACWMMRRIPPQLLVCSTCNPYFLLYYLLKKGLWKAEERKIPHQWTTVAIVHARPFAARLLWLWEQAAESSLTSFFLSSSSV